MILRTLASPSAFAAIAVAAVCVLGCTTRAKMGTARKSACELRAASLVAMTSDPKGSCPTVASLVASKAIVADVKDSWGGAFSIDCASAGDDISVTSAGPDGTKGTADDVLGNKETCASFRAK